MKSIHFILIIVFLWAGNVVAQISEDTISFSIEGGNIEGTLLIADQSQPTPVVLIIAGSGPTDRNGNNMMMVNNSLKMLAEGLAENGISSLRYDKRGIGASQITGVMEIDLRFDHYVEDARSWIGELASDPRFSEVAVLGHSEGALIGMIAVQESKAQKFISLAGGGSTAPDILREQFKSQPEYIQTQALPVLDSLEKGVLVDEIPQILFTLFRTSVQPYLISWFKYDPLQEIVKLNIPVLILQGTTDIQVGISEAQKLHETCEQSELHILEGMNHILKEAEMDRQKNIATYMDPDLPLKNGLIEIIVEFIRKK